MPGVPTPARRPENARHLCKLEGSIQTKTTAVRTVQQRTAAHRATVRPSPSSRPLSNIMALSSSPVIASCEP